MDRKKILIVDDEIDILRLTAIRLNKYGYDVMVAADGEEALRRIQGEKPDLVLLDIFMPDIPGTEICKRCKQDRQLKNVPIILFSANNATIANQEAKNSGADGFITKPFNADELIQRIKAVLVEEAVVREI